MFHEGPRSSSGKFRLFSGQAIALRGGTIASRLVAECTMLNGAAQPNAEYADKPTKRAPVGDEGGQPARHPGQNASWVGVIQGLWRAPEDAHQAKNSGQ